jgi:hypothetical protein
MLGSPTCEATRSGHTSAPRGITGGPRMVKADS